MHSFRSVQFLLFPRSCAGCGQSIPTSLLGIRPVQCIACQVYAHRLCAFSKTIQWSRPCPVNSSEFDPVNGNNENEKTRNEQPAASMELEEQNDENGQNTEQENNNPQALHMREQQQQQKQQQQQQRSENGSRCSVQSIFRSVDRDKSLLDSSLDDHSGVVNSSMYLLQPSESDDGLLEGRRRIQPPSSTSMSLSDSKTTNKIGGRFSDFPFLSSSKLFERDTSSSLHVIQKSFSWDVATSRSKKILTYERSKPRDNTNSKSPPPQEATNPVTTADMEPQTKDGYQINLLGDNHTKQGNDWFKQLSEALQENVIATFHPFVDKLKPRRSEEDNDDQNTRIQKTQTHTDDHDIATPSSSTDAAGSSEEFSENQSKARQDLISDHIDDANCKKNNCIEDESILGLVEEVQPKPDASVTRKRLGLVTVAGGIAGGVAGLAMAGPVGFIVGIKCGQVSGILGLILEGSLTVGALAGGIAAGAHTGQQLQDKLEETRVLALGVGTQRKLLLVRPNIQEPEPIWADFYKEARQSFPGSGPGIVKRFLPSEADTVKRERYERELDIVQTEEEEIPTSDKVLLLVSRTLNNKDSLPGHVYRCLVEKLRQRASDVRPNTINVEETNTGEGEKTTVSDIVVSCSKTRRKDTHAVIKYVTATLIEVRPGFASTPSLTELTATAVESLVFGEVYSYVMEEIEVEYEERDGELLRKIADYERSQHEQDEVAEKDYKDADVVVETKISEKALESLRYLPEAHSAVDKLRCCVSFLERISDFFSESQAQKSMGADSLLKMVCQHIVVAKLFAINAQVAFLEEFARDEHLLRGMEGYALVTLAASLHFLNGSCDFQKDVFGEEDDNFD
jgi:Vacuolar sorting protein 9 (VPS9) domain